MSKFDDRVAEIVDSALSDVRQLMLSTSTDQPVVGLKPGILVGIKDEVRDIQNNLRSVEETLILLRQVLIPKEKKKKDPQERQKEAERFKEIANKLKEIADNTEKDSLPDRIWDWYWDGTEENVEEGITNLWNWLIPTLTTLVTSFFKEVSDAVRYWTQEFDRQKLYNLIYRWYDEWKLYREQWDSHRLYVETCCYNLNAKLNTLIDGCDELKDKIDDISTNNDTIRTQLALESDGIRGLL